MQLDRAVPAGLPAPAVAGGGRASAASSGRAYVVNVSAMEGQFGGRRYKGAGHPHTNMAKAALNMLTRTSAGEMFETDKILMTAVDTGWITDERPHADKLRIAAEGWHAPLDLVDGAARVYDPVVLGEAGRGPLRLLREGLQALALVTPHRRRSAQLTRRVGPWAEMFTSQLMPNLSTSMPNSSPHGAGSSGCGTCRPRPARRSSHAARRRPRSPRTG